MKIIRARNLWKTDFMGKADPYVKIRLVNSVLSKTTRTKANTLNPEWHEIFKLPVQDPKSQSLELEVFDWEKLGAHEKMGMQIVPLKDLVDDEPKSFTLPLVKNVDPNDEANSKKSRGDIVFEMTFKAFKERNHTARQRAYLIMEVSCRSQSIRLRKWKASITPIPSWSCIFVGIKRKLW